MSELHEYSLLTACVCLYIKLNCVVLLFIVFIVAVFHCIVCTFDIYCCYQVAHLSLISALMVAWCASVATVDRVVQAVRSGLFQYLSRFRLPFVFMLSADMICT